MAKIMKTHSNGSTCLEGTQSVPKGFVACCEIFAEHTKACVEDIRYEWWSRSKQWVIAIVETSGGGGITISFCPHCGQKL
jgi:hypothetical protein